LYFKSSARKDDDDRLGNSILSEFRTRLLTGDATYGCNLGLTQAAKHIRGIVTAKELSFVNRRHVTVDIINRYNVLNLPGIWDDGTTATADGTKYELYEENLLSEYHIRYGGYLILVKVLS
jgi:Tn3 transposase DDE domain